MNIYIFFVLNEKKSQYFHFDVLNIRTSSYSFFSS